MSYKPQTQWQVSDDGSLVYNLKHRGWRKGIALMENDVSIRVDAPIEIRHQLASLLRDFMNQKYPVEPE